MQRIVRFLKLKWPLLLAFAVGGWATWRDSKEPLPYSMYENATRLDTTWYEVIVPKGKKIDKIILK